MSRFSGVAIPEEIARIDRDDENRVVIFFNQTQRKEPDGLVVKSQEVYWLHEGLPYDPNNLSLRMDLCEDKRLDYGDTLADRIGLVETTEASPSSLDPSRCQHLAPSGEQCPNKRLKNADFCAEHAAEK